MWSAPWPAAGHGPAGDLRGLGFQRRPESRYPVWNPHAAQFLERGSSALELYGNGLVT